YYMEQPIFNPNLHHLSQEKKPIQSQQTELDKFYEKIIDGELENLLETDQTYEFQSTPLKSAQLIKASHKRQIKEEMEQKEIREHISHAYDLIMSELPKMISPAEFEKLSEEFSNSVKNLQKMSQKSEEDLA